MRRARLLAAVGVGVLLGGTAAARQEAGGPPAPLPEPTLAMCEAKTLDLQEDLVKTQDLLAQWQARAIRAEAQIALAEIGRKRETLKASIGGAPK